MFLRKKFQLALETQREKVRERNRKSERRKRKILKDSTVVELPNISKYK
jgi:hypothetical protein